MEASKKLFEAGISGFDQIASEETTGIILHSRGEVKLCPVGAYGGSRTAPQQRDIAEAGGGDDDDERPRPGRETPTMGSEL